MPQPVSRESTAWSCWPNRRDYAYGVERNGRFASLIWEGLDVAVVGIADRRPRSGLMDGA